MVGYSRQLKCVSANIQSIFNKKQEIELYAKENNAKDILFFTESFITESHSVSEYLIDGFQPPVVCMKNRGGACGFIRNDIIFSEVCVPNPTEDSVWFSIKTEDNVNRLYGCVYRSPNSSSENNSKLCENVSWASEKFSEVILLGDYNFPSIK